MNPNSSCPHSVTGSSVAAAFVPLPFATTTMTTTTTPTPATSASTTTFSTTIANSAAVSSTTDCDYCTSTAAATSTDLVCPTVEVCSRSVLHLGPSLRKREIWNCQVDIRALTEERDLCPHRSSLCKNFDNIRQLLPSKPYLRPESCEARF